MKRPFIIAQSPMENTVRDFWKMATDNKVPAIVMLLDPTEEDEVKIILSNCDFVLLSW